LNDAYSLLMSAEAALALSLQGFDGWTDAFDERIHKLRPHNGQISVANIVRSLLKGSRIVRTVKNGIPDDVRPQDPYSFRCAPQVLGAAQDTFDFARRILEVEINSVTDNPLVFGRDGTVLSGGNFHGQPVAVALDVLALGLSTIATIAERRISALLDPSLNNGLPPFLVAKGTRPGLSSGLMALQYTAAALVAESKLLTHPASSDSIPTSANFEDFVSMGPGAAMKARKIMDNSQHVIAIELLVALQAIDLRGGSGLSVATKKIYNLLRDKIPPVKSDRPVHRDIEQAYLLVKNGAVANIVRKQISE
jgi:histidine ammonia-lyase